MQSLGMIPRMVQCLDNRDRYILVSLLYSLTRDNVLLNLCKTRETAQVMQKQDKCHACNVPIWPSNTTNELLHGMQILFSQDNHNHDQVLHEQTYNLPLLVPQNQVRPPFSYCDGTSGRVLTAPYSTDNVQHSNWVPSRLLTNVNTPIGSDSNIYFDKVKPAGQYTQWMDWLDVNATSGQVNTPQKSIDEKVASCCASGQVGGNVCSQTCVDWWTNRPVPPQGSLEPSSGVGAGCPWGTMPALSCYPCSVHNLYVRGSETQK